jgi:hypothetical protein
MTAYRDNDEREDEDEDWADDQEDYGDDSDDEPTVPCPYCRRDILEDSPRCPYCERYISEEDHASPKKPPWVIATAMICLGVAIWWVLAAR